MPDQPRPAVGQLTLRDAAALAASYDAQFRRAAKGVERLPAHAPRRRKRGMRAVGYLRAAIFWRVLAAEHPTQPDNARVAALVGPRELQAIWIEAAERARMAAREGAVRPGAQRRALEVAAGYVPGKGGLPKRTAEGQSTDPPRFGVPWG